MGASARRHPFRRSLWYACGFGLWLFLGNRAVLQWPSSALKLLTMSVLAFALYRTARILEARLRGLSGILLPGLILLGFAAGEAWRAWLHHQYRADMEFSTTSRATSLTRPFTTTALVVNTKTLPLPNMKGHLRVAQLTDLHFTTSLRWEYYQSIAESLREEKPDLIVMTGDFISKSEHLPLLARFLALPMPSRLGSFASLGNHDYWAEATGQVRRILQEAGVRVLSGSCTRLSDTDFASVQLCGTEAPWGADFQNPERQPTDVTIVLSHTPDNIYSLSGRANVVFAGHYHAGQWRLPWVGPLAMPSVYGRRFDRGHFSVDGVELFVSAGLGADFPPLRIYCPPELLVVNLVPYGATSTVAR